MFNIIAASLRTASRTDALYPYDHRTSAERRRDAEEKRRWMRQTGIL